MALSTANMGFSDSLAAFRAVCRYFDFPNEPEQRSFHPAGQFHVFACICSQDSRNRTLLAKVGRPVYWWGSVAD